MNLLNLINHEYRLLKICISPNKINLSFILTYLLYYREYFNSFFFKYKLNIFILNLFFQKNKFNVLLKLLIVFYRAKSNPKIISKIIILSFIRSNKHDIEQFFFLNIH